MLASVPPGGHWCSNGVVSFTAIRSFGGRIPCVSAKSTINRQGPRGASLNPNRMVNVCTAPPAQVSAGPGWQ